MRGAYPFQIGLFNSRWIISNVSFVLFVFEPPFAYLSHFLRVSRPRSTYFFPKTMELVNETMNRKGFGGDVCNGF